MDQNILPVLDMNLLQQKAQEAAMRGAISCIEEYYSGYDSPFKKAISDQLKNQKASWSLDLPDILALINEKLAKEIDTVANTAVAKSFAPMVTQFLTREDKEIKFSDLLKEFVELLEIKTEDDCSVSVKENASYGWLDVDIEGNEKSYSFTIHEDYDSNKAGLKRYHLLRLPHESTSYKKGGANMKVSVDNATLEIPFTRDVLSDPFISYLARLVISNSLIEMDVSYFREDMFPQDECHCH